MVAGTLALHYVLGTIVFRKDTNMLHVFPRTTALGAVLLAFVAPAQAEIEVSVYGGWQTSPHSRVTVRGHPDQPDGTFTAGWEGRPFAMPPYYGLRVTQWSSRDTGWGWGVHFTHAKTYADAATLAATAFDHLEMTDGHNIVTVNAMYRWQEAGRRWTPYVGGGVGYALPHFEAISANDRTWGYQLTGPAVRVLAGVSYALTENWSVFSEYGGTYSWNTMRFDAGGTMRTNIVTNAVNLGISYSF